MFAKLYGTDEDQVLVTLEIGDDGNPCVRFSCKPEGFGICTFSLGFPDTDEGHDDADAAFKEIDEARAREIIKDTVLGTLPDIH